MNINPGELNKKIKIVSFSVEKDKDGFETDKKEKECSCENEHSRMSAGMDGMY